MKNIATKLMMAASVAGATPAMAQSDEAPNYRKAAQAPANIADPDSACQTGISVGTVFGGVGASTYNSKCLDARARQNAEVPINKPTPPASTTSLTDNFVMTCSGKAGTMLIVNNSEGVRLIANDILDGEVSSREVKLDTPISKVMGATLALDQCTSGLTLVAVDTMKDLETTAKIAEYQLIQMKKPVPEIAASVSFNFAPM